MQPYNFSYKDEPYPPLLREIANPPQALHVRGDFPLGPYVAIVGTRRISNYGKEVTYKLAYDLARAGVTIVSGLALGVDGIAHQAAIEAGGKTVAVLACGIEQVYPSSHRWLANKIVNGRGAIITEQPEGMPPLKQNFVSRNRIVAGMSVATIVTESPASGGSLITAAFALDENRQVFAVPGNITQTNSAGPNNLIRTGATPITDTADILTMLDLESASHKPVKAESKEEALIFELLGQGINSSDELIRQGDMSATEFANIITLMEITGKVRNLGAGTWMVR